MPIDPGGVRVGHCYAVSGGQRRKVAAIVDGRVHHDPLDGEAPSSTTPQQAEFPTLEAFAGMVEREVPCPDVARAKPSQAEG